MKLILSGDWHITDKHPEHRTDDYLETAIGKLRFIFRTAVRNKVAAVIQPGDLTDSPAISYECFSRLVQEINSYDIQLYTVYGQHDLRYRHKENTALHAIEKSCPRVHIIDCTSAWELDDKVFITGSGYGEDIPLATPQSMSILVTHRMVINEKLWEAQKEFDWANNLMRKHRYDLIVAGDNHKGFTVETPKRSLVNCGALLRSTSDQIDHKPFIILYDTETRSCEKIMVPIKSAKTVFELDKVAEEKERDEKIDAFVSGLSEHKEMGLSFGDSLTSFYKENNISKEVIGIIEEASR
jgi:DNA repair exonuclease SbcCD nuclease subunit